MNLIFLAIILLLLSSCDQPTATFPEFDSDDIAGIVTSEEGVEAGVWVIAETQDLDTRFARIVVTDSQGRYVVPDLPAASYEVWVRGYGLIDSGKLNARPGARIDHRVKVATNEAEAALVYPAAYWYAMMKLPTTQELEGIDGGLNMYLTWMKNMGCVGCHQMGQHSTRTLPSSLLATLLEGVSSEEMWARRIQAGQAGNSMMRISASLKGLPVKYLAEWTDRIASGEHPGAHPERPEGVERHVVATVRDWSNAKAYLHDLSGTDRRDPTVNGFGKLYGAPELSTDKIPILNPVVNRATHYMAPVRDEDTPTTNSQSVVAASHYWGEEAIWDSRANIHNPMLDAEGRVWFTARIRGPENPDFCTDQSDHPSAGHPSAKMFPTARSGRQISVYDPKTGEYQFVDTCYSTHHLQFAEDDRNTLWTSGGGQVLGWLDTKLFLETGDSAASQGWAPLILDTNGNGRQDTWVAPDQAVDPTLDKRIPAAFYAVMPNPADGTVWGSNAFRYPGSIVRYDPQTNLGEIYNVPLPGFGVRGADIDRNGIVWVSLGSGHLGEFDRRRCTGKLNGPEATGDHCPEGWTFHDLPGPAFAQLPGFSVESSYYTWVDQHDTLGLGANVPIATGNLFDGIHALVDNEFVTLRIPYPMGFYAKGMEGRIDDPDAGWKGRGIWATSGDRTPWLMEGGKGSKPLVVHFQMRPDSLAH